jgi:hypothetical protein
VPYCDHCGAEAQDAARFCESCGAALPPEGSSTDAGAPDGYEIRGILGRGASGVVYLAWQAEPGRLVALKALDPELSSSSGFQQRFADEARALESMAHPNLVELYDFFSHQGRGWIAMGYVDGASLRKVMEISRRLEPEQALGVLDGALGGLGYAHERQILHGDIKPENILVDRSGVSKLVDFGQVARVGETTTGGTPAYMSPESARGEPSDQRSDLYSAGIVLYEALAGRPPFVATNDLALLRMQVSEPPPRAPHMAQPLADLLGRALAKDPAARPQSARSFLEELDEAAQAAYGRDWKRRSAIAGAVAAVTATAATLAVGSPAAAATTAGSAPAVVRGQATRAVRSHLRTSRRTGRVARSIATHKVAASVVALVVVAGAAAGGVLGSRGGAPPTQIPELAPSYAMTFDNLSVSTTADGSLSGISEDRQGNLRGQMVVNPPLYGSGPFTGTATNRAVSFTVESTMPNICNGVCVSIQFTGTLNSAGTIRGTYIVHTEAGGVNNTKGTWRATPQKAEVSPSTGTQVYFYGDLGNAINLSFISNPLEVRPSSILMFEDGSWVIQGLRWSGWGSRVAHGVGVSSSSNCNPNCADGTRTNLSAQIALSSPGSVLGHHVYRCFQLTVPSYPGSDEYECLTDQGGLYAYAPVPKPATLAAGFYSVPEWFCSMSPQQVSCENTPLGYTAHVLPNGKTAICKAGPAACQVGNPGLGTPTLRRGEQVTSGQFRCTFTSTGLTCVVIKTGQGFMLTSSTTVSRVT